MKTLSKLLLCITVSFIVSNSVSAQDVWVNDTRNIFLKNSTVMYEVNLRTFNAQDINGNGIIEFNEGEESGNFLNAIDRLDELVAGGINTIHLMPIMAIGKTKALGTAGSLYAASSFNTLNPQLGSKRTALSLESQAIKFINEAHKRRIRVIVDLPSCGSYDLYMKNPSLFVKDNSGQPVIPADWTDVRLFNAGTEGNINREVYNLYRDYVDYVIKLGVDGIRADVATTKPAKFWKDLIEYSRRQDPQFAWIAEASELWNEPVSKEAIFTPYSKLLEAGFDGYYGSYMDLKNMKTGKELIKYIESTLKFKEKYSQPKAVIGSFSTHDELSPILIGGTPFAEMTFWLNAVLPTNFYTVDGIPTGDNYIYFWANKKAPKTYTDDDYYFAHRGKIDIFNFSRRPGGKNMELYKSFQSAVNFKYYMTRIYNSPSFKFTEFKTSKPEIYSFGLSDSNQTILVIGNISQQLVEDAVIYLPKYEDKDLTFPVKMQNTPISEKGKMKTNIYPYEIQIFVIDKYTP